MKIALFWTVSAILMMAAVATVSYNYVLYKKSVTMAQHMRMDNLEFLSTVAVTDKDRLLFAEMSAKATLETKRADEQTSRVEALTIAVLGLERTLDRISSTSSEATSISAIAVSELQKQRKKWNDYMQSLSNKEKLAIISWEQAYDKINTPIDILPGLDDK